ARRNPGLAGMTATLLFLLLAIAVASSVTAFYLHATLVESEANRRQAEDAERDRREQLWRSDLARAQALRWSGRAGRRFESLAALRQAAAIRPSLELRNEAIACMALMDLRVASQWQLQPPAAASFDNALERYAVSDHEGTIIVRRCVD